jgi:hypothetical protein
MSELTRDNVDARQTKTIEFCRITNLHVRTFFFNVVKTVHFGMKLYNNQRNAQVFSLFIYLLLGSSRWATPAVCDFIFSKLGKCKITCWSLD